MASMFSGWFGSGSSKPDAATKVEEKQEPAEASPKTEQGEGDKSEESSTSSVKKDSTSFEKQLDDARETAVNTAKEWGGYLMNFGKSATKTVSQTANKVKSKLEDNTILGEFNREQQKFTEENEEKRKHAEAAVAPWVGYSEETVMKQQILALSQDKRNFMRNPPAGVQFNFDYSSHHKVALATLQEDANLQKMRFELVPKQISEESFWRNYFYRVSLIKQSTQLSTLTSESADQSGADSEKESSKPSTPVMDTSRLSPPVEAEDVVAGSPPAEFVSDAFEAEVSAADLQRDMEQLRVTDDGGWADGDLEDELQQELEDYDVVPGDDEDLEAEILRQLEAEADKS